MMAISLVELQARGNAMSDFHKLRGKWENYYGVCQVATDVFMLTGSRRYRR
jgi:hypothetical protein